MITDYEKDVSIRALAQAIQMYCEMKKAGFNLYVAEKDRAREELISQIRHLSRYELSGQDDDYIDFLENTDNTKEDELEGCMFTLSYDDNYNKWRISKCITLFFKGDEYQWDTDIETVSELLSKKCLILDK